MELLFNHLEQKIKSYTESIWEGKVTWDIISEWLNNFKDTTLKEEDQKKEKLIALYLLSKFMYFGIKEIRELLKSLYRDKFRYPIISTIRKKNDNFLNSATIEKLYDIELNNTRFLGVGNPSESGMHLLYYFRQENQLSKKLFINSIEIFNSDSTNLDSNTINNYVFIDDFCGTGDQANNYSNRIIDKIKKFNKDIKIYYFSLFATKTGITNVIDNTNFNVVDSLILFDETFKCFEKNSRYFNDNNILLTKELKEEYEDNISIDKAKEICLKYIEIIKKNIEINEGNKDEYNPLGYKNSQLLTGFFHNTPNNTLPIFRLDEKNIWKPIFKRYPKIYGV